MTGTILNKKISRICRSMSVFIMLIFLFNVVIPPHIVMAQGVSKAAVNLPTPGSKVTISQSYVPVLLKGMTIHPNDPLRFDFIVDSGFNELDADQVKVKSEKLIRYFMSGLTIPKSDLWVNLSPYESDRIITTALSHTELGRDLLAQDYLLKQLTSTLIYPEEDLGDAFWKKVYKKVYDQYGITELPVSTFNKVWILPDEAVISEQDNSVHIVKCTMKVMLEEDYLALQKNKDAAAKQNQNIQRDVSTLSSKIFKELILPEIEKEVNTGKNFATLRQIYHSLILAKWYKETVTNGLLAQVYNDQNKILGIDVSDPELKNKIYQRYLEAFKLGVFDYVKEEYDQFTNKLIPRSYFSGGITEFMDVDLTRSARNVRGENVGQRFILEIGAYPRQNGDEAMLAEDIPNLPTVGEIRLVDTYFEEAQKENYWKTNELLPLEEVTDAVYKKFQDARINVEREVVAEYLLNTPGYPIQGNKYLALAQEKLAGVSNGLDGVGIGRATFFEREDVEFKYPFVAPTDDLAARDRKVAAEQQHIQDTFDNYFNGVSSLKDHPSYKALIEHITEYIANAVDKRMEFSYRLLHELIRKSNDDFRSELKVDEQIAPDELVDTLKQELLDLFIPRFVQTREPYVDSTSIFAKAKDLYERFKLLRSAWAIILTHPYSLDRIIQYHELVKVYHQVQARFNAALDKPEAERDETRIDTYRREMKRINRFLDTLSKEIDGEQATAAVQEQVFLSSFIPETLAVAKGEANGWTAYELMDKYEKATDDKFKNFKDKGIWHRGFDAIVEAFTAFRFVKSRLDSHTYITSYSDSPDVQGQKKNNEIMRLERTLKESRALYILEKLRKKARQSESLIDAEYLRILEGPEQADDIVMSLFDEDQDFKLFYTSLESFLKSRVESRGLAIHSSLANFLAVYFDESLYEEVAAAIDLPRFEDSVRATKFESMVYDFSMVFASILAQDGTKRNEEPVVVIIDPNIDALTPNEVGSVSQKHKNIVAFVEKGRSPHAINQFPMSVSAVNNISEANINEGDVVIVEASSKGSGEILVRPDVKVRLKAYKAKDEIDRKQEYFYTAAGRLLTLGGKAYHSFVSLGIDAQRDVRTMKKLAEPNVGLHRLELLFENPYKPGLWKNESIMTTEFVSVLNSEVFNGIASEGIRGRYIPRLDDVGGEKKPQILVEYLRVIEKQEGPARMREVEQNILKDYSGTAFYFYRDQEGKQPFYEHGLRQLRALFKAYYKADNKRLGFTFPNVKIIEGVVNIDDILGMIQEARDQAGDGLFEEEKELRGKKRDELKAEVETLQGKEQFTEEDRISLENKQEQLSQLEEEYKYFVEDRNDFLKYTKKLFDEVKVGFYVEDVDQLVHYDEMVRRSDFVEIGTNDMLLSLFQKDFPELTRYDTRYSYIFDDLQPRLFEVSWIMAKISKRHGKPLLISGDWGNSIRFGGMLGLALALRYEAQVYAVSSPYLTARQRAYMQFVDPKKLVNPTAQSDEERGLLDRVLKQLEDAYQNDFAQGFRGVLKDREGFIDQIQRLQDDIEPRIEEEIRKAEGTTDKPTQDNAVLGTEENEQRLGGIDLKNVELIRKTPGITIEFDPLTVDNILNDGPVDGFSPVIINVVPVMGIPPLLGSGEPDFSEPTATDKPDLNRSFPKQLQVSKLPLG